MSGVYTLKSNQLYTIYMQVVQPYTKNYNNNNKNKNIDYFGYFKFLKSRSHKQYSIALIQQFCKKK